MLTDEGIGNRVIVAICAHLEVVVDADLGALERRELIARRRERSQRRSVEGRKQRRPLPSIFLNGRSLIQRTRRVTSAFSADRLVKRALRSRAMMKRSARSTAPSAFALSRGL